MSEVDGDARFRRRPRAGRGPCEPVGEPALPPEYTTITANDITVAWSPETPATTGPTDIALRATSVAYLVGGILDEAALSIEPEHEL